MCADKSLCTLGCISEITQRKMRIAMVLIPVVDKRGVAHVTEEDRTMRHMEQLIPNNGMFETN